MSMSLTMTPQERQAVDVLFAWTRAKTRATELGLWSVVAGVLATVTAIAGLFGDVEHATVNAVMTSINVIGMVIALWVRQRLRRIMAVLADKYERLGGLGR